MKNKSDSVVTQEHIDSRCKDRLVRLSLGIDAIVDLCSLISCMKHMLFEDTGELKSGRIALRAVNNIRLLGKAPKATKTIIYEYTVGIPIGSDICQSDTSQTKYYSHDSPGQEVRTLSFIALRLTTLG